MTIIKMHYSYLLQKSTLLIHRNLYNHYTKFQIKLPNIDNYSRGVNRHNALTVPCNTWDKQYNISKYL